MLLSTALVPSQCMGTEAVGGLGDIRRHADLYYDQDIVANIINTTLQG